MSRILILAITLEVEGVKQEKGGSFRSDLSLPEDVLFINQSPYAPWLPQNHSYGEPPGMEGGWPASQRSWEETTENHNAAVFQAQLLVTPYYVFIFLFVLI